MLPDESRAFFFELPFSNSVLDLHSFHSGVCSALEGWCPLIKQHPFRRDALKVAIIALLTLIGLILIRACMEPRG